MYKFIVAYLCLNIGIQVIAIEDWDYNNQDKWSEGCLKGSMQSPIALSTMYSTFGEFTERISFNFPKKSVANITNTGHTVQIRLVNSTAPEIKTPFHDNFIVDNWHFHWQAEHTIDNQRFPLEMHIVCYKKEYRNLSTALQFKEGVAVIAIVFWLSQTDNKELESLINGVRSVAQCPLRPEKELTFYAEALLPDSPTIVFQYTGSLTTPPCTESILWFVIAKPVLLSANQLNIFKMVRSKDGNILGRTNRQLQKRHSRAVLRVGTFFD